VVSVVRATVTQSCRRPDDVPHETETDRTGPKRVRTERLELITVKKAKRCRATDTETVDSY